MNRTRKAVVYIWPLMTPEARKEQEIVLLECGYSDAKIVKVRDKDILVAIL